MPQPNGGLAQLGERLAGSQKVIGSSPLSSTEVFRTTVQDFATPGFPGFLFAPVVQTAVNCDLRQVATVLGVCCRSALEIDFHCHSGLYSRNPLPFDCRTEHETTENTE